MHVLITADTLGGVWIYTKELVSGLLRRGHHVTLVSLGRVPTGDQSRWMDGLGGLDFLATRYRLEWMQNCEQDIAESREFLSNLALQLRPDILHLNQYCYGTHRASWWLIATCSTGGEPCIRTFPLIIPG